MSARSLIHRLLDQRENGPYGRGRCAYCGHRTYGRTCAAHRDLPQLEQHANDGPDAFPCEEQASGPRSKGV